MNILVFIKQNKFYYHEGRDRWYSVSNKWNVKMGETTYYTEQQLLKFINL